jgi:hypothetical protein
MVGGNLFLAGSDLAICVNQPRNPLPEILWFDGLDEALLRASVQSIFGVMRVGCG